MKISITGINIVGQADITVNGLAVIAGENGSGKSTVGKTIFATLKAIASSRNDISASRKKAVGDLADPVFSRLFKLRLTDNNSAFDEFVPASRAHFINELCAMTSESAVRNYFAPILEAVADRDIASLLARDIDAIAAYIALQPDTNDAIAVALNRLLRSEFLGNISSDAAGPSCVSFADTAADMSLAYSINHNNVAVTSCSGKSLLRDVTYIESPLYLHLLDILGKVSGAQFFDNDNTATALMLPAHVADIVEKIESLRYSCDMQYVRDALSSTTLAQIAGGTFFYDTARHAVMFRQGDNDIVPLNVASGVKSLGLLQILLDNKMVSPERPLIWDEPENHLHPSWQIRLAQFFVILAAQGVPIIVSTHSPYFIQGIRHFAVKMKAEQYVDYYLTEMNGSTSITQCVNDDLNRIFIKLAAPLNEIMDLSSD